MRRISLIVIVALFVMSMSVVAGDFEFVGGPTISKIDLDIILTESTDKISVKTDDGSTGFYAGVRYKFDNGFILGGGYESQSFDLGLSGSYNSYGDHLYLDNSLSGLYLEGLYEVNDIFALRGAVNSNSLNSKLDVDLDDIKGFPQYNEDFVKGSGLGYQVGVELNYPINDNLSILSNASYVTCDIDIDKVYNPFDEEWMDIDDIFGPDVSVDYSAYKFAFGLNYNY